MQTHKSPLPPLTDEQDARITAAIEADPDAWILTEEDFAEMRPFAEVHPELAERIRKHGARITTETLATVNDFKEEITVELDAGLVTYFRQTGDGWQQLLNDTLRNAVFGEDIPTPVCNEGALGCKTQHDDTSPTRSQEPLAETVAP